MNITLIGMPGSGKSFIGERLASALSYTPIELDCITELSHQKPLQEVLDTIGETNFLLEQAHDAITHTTNCNDSVISPGGSISYSEQAMQHLKNISKIVYLKTSIETIQNRIKVIPRGIVGLNDSTFEELYSERTALYEKWADCTIDAECDANMVVNEIQEQLGIKN